MNTRSVLLSTALCLSPLAAFGGSSGSLGNLTTLAQADLRSGSHDDRAWVQLGCRDVSLSMERDVIDVGRREGGFTAIQLKASGNDVEMLELKIIYSNGDPDEIPVRSVVRAGSQVGPFDLNGRERSIDRVELRYKTMPNFRGQAQICVEGLKGERRAEEKRRAEEVHERWIELACHNVNFSVDHDEINVGGVARRFTALRLRASGNDVEMLDLKVVYASDDIPVRSVIRSGSETGPLNLTGKEQRIDRIELYYKTTPNFPGEARICVEGLQGER
ncbi:MAG: hypothetical protein ACLPKB_35060 [Xanthobacteraceae bacterium]